MVSMRKTVAGILAHVDAGKTTLSEALLYEAGKIKKLGRVDNKDSYLDTDTMERERGITIFSKIARLSFGDCEYTLVDTPGHVDFSGEMERVLDILDEAILIINASNKVQAHTKTVWKLLRERNIPTFIFVNKMDLPDTDKADILMSLKKELSSEIIDFSDDGSDAFFEDVATGSEELLNSYMEDGNLSVEQVKDAVNNCLVFPVYFGSALKNDGVKQFLNGITKYSSESKYANDFGAVCYKITRENGTRLSHLKITGGKLPIKAMLNGEKVNEIRLYSGTKYETASEVFGGDICAVTGLKDSRPGMRYGAAPKGKGSALEPVLTYAIIYPSEVDTALMHKYLLEIEEEEPGLKVEFNENTRDIYVHLMGEVQTEILARQIEDRYGITISFGPGKVLYKETITDTVEGVGHFEPLRHYAEVHLKLEPLPAGSGLVFDSTVSVDDLALNWQSLVLTHLGEKMHKGVLTGAPITDIKITLVAGKAHIKHTEGGDFRQATYRAVRQGLMQASSVLLEPFYYYELTVPDFAVGRAMTDIDRMCGSAVVSEQRNGESVITGTAPVATLNGYAKDVYAYTKGKGVLSVSSAGYEPCHNADEIIIAKRYDPTADIKNTPDSVFCSHGAGTIIPWDEVFNYMHIPLSTEERPSDVTYEDMVSTERKEVFVTTEEVDKIIHDASHANENGRKGAYKGISAALREKNRVGGRGVEKPMVYKGTETKKKFILVDGYNVVHAWEELSSIADRDINGAAGRLMDIVSNYSGLTGIETILVFDAYKVPGHATEVMDYHNIKVVYTKTAETADRYIERYAHENGKKYDITVITSDGVEQVIIRGAGCFLMSSRDFVTEYTRMTEQMQNIKLSEGISISTD